MMGGTMFGVWLGQLISEYGIRNQGLSLIIFAGIVAGIPSNFGGLLADEQNRWLVLVILAILALIIFAIVFVQQGRRNIPVIFPGRRVGNRMSMPVKSSLPLMVNMAGMIPLIFAQSLLTFPALVANFFVNNKTEWVANFARGVQDIFGAQSAWYGLVIFPVRCGFHFLLHGCIVCPAELWRQFEKIRCTNSRCYSWGTHPEISYQSPAPDNFPGCLVPGSCGCLAIYIWCSAATQCTVQPVCSWFRRQAC